jgi:2-polyprenyl-6-methoxyphenol hydroxylase-like FAD-dependent oxidoreductase
VERLGEDRVHTGHAFETVLGTGARAGEPVAFRLRRRHDQAEVEASADILVGADGIHSAVRRHFYPSGDAPRFSRRMLWRAVTEAPPYLDGRSMFMAGHQDQKFVAYPISEPLRRQGRSLVNWIAELRVPDHVSDTPPRSDWNRQVDKSVFREAFAGWQWDWIDIPALIDGAEAIYEFPLVDKDPLPRWTFDRVTLLGDAAHPMYPIGSNGSAQAILDARYLAEERAPQGFAEIGQVIPHAELEAIALRYKQLAGFDRQSLQPARR